MFICLEVWSLMSAPGVGSHFAGGLILPQGKGLVLLFLFDCTLGIPGKLYRSAASAGSWPPLLHTRLNWETELLFFFFFFSPPVHSWPPHLAAHECLAELAVIWKIN